MPADAASIATTSTTCPPTLVTTGDLASAVTWWMSWETLNACACPSVCAAKTTARNSAPGRTSSDSQRSASCLPSSPSMAVTSQQPIPDKLRAVHRAKWRKTGDVPERPSCALAQRAAEYDLHALRPYRSRSPVLLAVDPKRVPGTLQRAVRLFKELSDCLAAPQPSQQTLENRCGIFPVVTEDGAELTEIRAYISEACCLLRCSYQPDPPEAFLAVRLFRSGVLQRYPVRLGCPASSDQRLCQDYRIFRGEIDEQSHSA